MHSTGSIVQAAAADRPGPAHSAGTSVAEMTWLGMMSASCSNHHRDSCVRILPLSGIGRRQHDVVHADPVGRDEDQVVAVRVDVADLARVDQLHVSRNLPPTAPLGPTHRYLRTYRSRR